MARVGHPRRGEKRKDAVNPKCHQDSAAGHIALNVLLNNREAQGRFDPDQLADLLTELEELPEADLTGFDPGTLAANGGKYLANTDALIIDLRQNGGGSPAMVALLCSYLFAGERKHLNDLAWRVPEGERIDQWWTVPHVAGKRYADKDVYILTSKRTFSAAEEFTYNLQALQRATVVGETTGGGAHPGGVQPINDHFDRVLLVAIHRDVIGDFV